MSKNANAIFLGRDGKVFGPISSAQFEELKASGELARYRYWWDPKAQAWQAVESPPPNPTTVKAETALEGMHAVCHDRGMTLVAGRLENVTDQGCQLVSHDHRDLPSFGEQSSLVLNLADTESGHSLNVRAMLRQVWRRGQAWVYQLAWEKTPHLSRE